MANDKHKNLKEREHCQYQHEQWTLVNYEK